MFLSKLPPGSLQQRNTFFFFFKKPCLKCNVSQSLDHHDANTHQSRPSTVIRGQQVCIPSTLFTALCHHASSNPPPRNLYFGVCFHVPARLWLCEKFFYPESYCNLLDWSQEARPHPPTPRHLCAKPPELCTHSAEKCTEVQSSSRVVTWLLMSVC